jgi:UDP-N-acetylglucosamine 3-dehydrogenase
MVTVGILGAGFMASSHAAIYQSLEGRARVKTVCSRSPEAARKVAATVGAAVATDVDELLNDPEIDAVDICVPTGLHRAFAERALAAGKHAFVEKPIALSAEDADAIVDAAKHSGRMLMVGLVLRFWPEYVELQRRMANRELGRPLTVSAFRLSPPAGWNDWMRDKEKSGGTAVDLLIHDFDQMNWLLGAPRTVCAREPVPGHVQAVVEYDDATGFAEGSMAMPESYPFSSNVRVLAERGLAEYSFGAAPAEEGGNIGASDTARGLRLFPVDSEPRTIAVESTDPWGPEIKYFIECLEQGRHPEQGTGEQAKQALLVSLAANRSIASGRSEPVLII